MTAILFIGGIALLAGAGAFVLRMKYVQDLDWPARTALMFCAGVVVMTVAMFVLSVTGIRWSRASLFTVFATLAAASVRVRPAQARSAGRLVWLPIGGFVAVLSYAALTARVTSGDLLYFWGAKAHRFYYAGRIDHDFLGFPLYFSMHADYPPLIPLLYGWGATAAHRFSWWGALLTLPLFLLATAAAFRGMAAAHIGEAAANAHAILLTAILATTYAISMVGGGGEPPLLFFETVALVALTFAGGDRGAYAIAAIALAGAVFTKVEGAAFTAVVLAAFVVTRWQVRAAIAVAAAPALVLGSWLLFAWRHHLLDAYAARESVRLHLLGTVTALVAKQVDYRTFYLPWLAAIAPLAWGRPSTAQRRRASLPLLTAAGAVAYTLYFYLHTDTPALWITWSAERVMLTPLMALVVASASASE
jgi:hypothetical protein